MVAGNVFGIGAIIGYLDARTMRKWYKIGNKLAVEAVTMSSTTTG